MNEKQRILIIEDDADLVAATAKMLGNRGYETDFAYDPEEGLKKLAVQIPDLIILDVMFGTGGKSKGFDFAQKIRNENRFKDIPILMMTGINSESPFFHFSPETDGEFLPVDAFLDKPVKPEELFNKVQELLKK